MGWHACILCVIWNDLMWPMLLYRLQHNGTRTVSIYSSCSLLYRKKVVTPISVLCPLQSRGIFMPWWFICVLKEGILLSLSFKISQVLHFNLCRRFLSFRKLLLHYTFFFLLQVLCVQNMQGCVSHTICPPVFPGSNMLPWCSSACVSHVGFITFGTDGKSCGRSWAVLQVRCVCRCVF